MQNARRLVYPAMGLYAFGTYGAFLYFKSQQPYQGGLGEGRTWDQISDSYDSELGLDETLMGIKLFRRWLVRQAKGDVLEVSAGTGRNLPYYRYDQLTSLTLTDTSKYMLWHANQKFRDKYMAKAGSLPVSFHLTDAQRLLPPRSAAAGAASPSAAAPAQASQQAMVLTAQTSSRDLSSRSSSSSSSSSGSSSDSEGPTVDQLPRQVSSVFSTRTESYRDQSFDTVVDTFGLCSHGNPVEALQEMARVCKPGGQILLLEHGRAGTDWLNDILDKGAQRHLMKWGCQWNRDIEDIVKKAGLKVELLNRWHFGTTYVIIVRPEAAST